ncbi:hypothetical protein QVD17_15541 [Tagetes erecta]|uniref:LOB domain-containing protein n=1 Tax=Tagetes erecta TaxID=13708 RepID=A0AAD8KTI4_TARER|nr:hypothetical protein QVD17_15541 [Tagetes erecta]
MSREFYDEAGMRIKRETDDNYINPTTTVQMTRRQVLVPTQGTLNTITPCAACKLLRRRCAEECPFSPYFSPNEPYKFAAVHKVFGASNVSKLLMEVPESQRADAANSLVFEANVRLRDPIYGCMDTNVLKLAAVNTDHDINIIAPTSLVSLGPFTATQPSITTAPPTTPPPRPSIGISSSSSSFSLSSVCLYGIDPFKRFRL